MAPSRDMRTPAHVLVLGGIRSGKSEFAEAMVGDAESVRYLATARDDGTDPQWTARIEEHRTRRPQAWSTSEVGADPRDLIGALDKANPTETLLIDDLGTWLAGAMVDEALPDLIDRLAAAVRACPSRTVLVSPEVGLATVPTTETGRAFADGLGRLNQAVADACEAAVLVVAGQPM